MTANKDITEVVFIIDRSGSMCGLEGDTIGGFNSVIKKQKGIDGETYITTVLFNHTVRTLHDRVPLSEVKPLTEEDYVADGMTALLDAMGTTVSSMNKRYKGAERPKILFVTITDGLENSSHEYDTEKLRKLVEKCKKKGDEFIFLGANMDAFGEASRFGLSRNDAVDYRCDGEGLRACYISLDKAVYSIRADRQLNKSWRTEVDEDFESRF